MKFTPARLNLYLVISVTLPILLVTVATYSTLDEILNEVISLSLNAEVKTLLSAYAKDLKTMVSMGIANETLYRERFADVTDALMVYRSADQITNILQASYQLYFSVVFMIAIVLGVVVALYFNSRVAKSHKSLIDEVLEQEARISHLKQYEDFQRLSKFLSHEIKNPLLPIEMMVSNLKEGYERGADSNFPRVLDDTCRIVGEEVARLKNMVSHFSKFSQLPAPRLVSIDCIEFLTDFVSDASAMWPSLQMKKPKFSRGKLLVLADEPLLKQCLMNIVLNAVEANKGQSIEVTFEVNKRHRGVEIVIWNSGSEIPEYLLPSVFDIAVSSKSEQENMGLGLAVVKKIMLEHGGDVRCLQVSSGVAFALYLDRRNADE